MYEQAQLSSTQTMSWTDPKLRESNRSRPPLGTTDGLTGQVKVSFGLLDVSDAELAFLGNRRLLLALLAAHGLPRSRLYRGQGTVPSKKRGGR